MNSENQLFPIFLKANELRFLIVGGGVVAMEKLNALITNSPLVQITLVAEEISNEIIEFAENRPNITLIDELFDEKHLENHDLLISAINDTATSEKICSIASSKQILVNAADKPELCDFYLGSIVTKGHVKLAISTNGKSPTLAKRLREIFDESIPDELSESAEHLNKIRETLKGDFKDKVLQLNELTKDFLKTPKKTWKQISILKVSIYAFVFLSVMVTGHLIFSLIPPKQIWLSCTEVFSSLDNQFILFIVGGFIAQMIDGALGMAYGVSASTFLISIGVSPSVASMSVHSSEIFTSGVSGFMHLRFGNVNSRLFKSLVLPGVIGAIVGAYFLTSMENYSSYIKPIVSFYTLFLGVLIIVKVIKKNTKRKKVKKAGWLALLGGFLDSIGGGGWGPVVSSTLIARGKHPRMVIGSVNLAEFFVSLASSFAFFSVLGTVTWQPILGLIIGGVCAAPLAAYFSSRLNIKPMMIIVGIVVIIVSLRNIISIIF
jgi:siroheme synthase-like protein